MNGGMSLGRVMPLYKGEYDPGQAYGQNDVVRLDGRVYWHTGREKTVGVPPTEEQVWHLLLEAGAASARKDAKFAEKVMLYYGYPNAINESWDVNNSAAIYKDYDICIFGDGYCLPSHEAYAETVQIFSIMKSIAPNTRIVGYVPIGVKFVGEDSNLSMEQMKARVDAWKKIGAHGIFLDEFGYDYGVTRARQNEIVGYCHGLGMFVFANSWSTDYCFSDEDITIDDLPGFHPNPDNTRAVLNRKDYYVYEHLFYNSYTDDAGVLHIDCADTYRLDDIISYSMTPKIGGKTYKEFFGTKLFSLDSIPTAASITQKNEMMSLSIIGSAILNVDAIAFGDEFWGSGSHYHQWDFPEIDLKTEGANSVSRATRSYTDAEGVQQDFTYKWSASINGNLYSIVFDVATPDDVTYKLGKRYAECNGVKVENVWLTVYDFQNFLKETGERVDAAEQLVAGVKKSVDEAMPTVTNAEATINAFMAQSKTELEGATKKFEGAMKDIEMLTAGFQYQEREW